ncbi:quinone-dependent dihydroorotate dehydrogenase [Larsenimonas rhizosphaerae]|uniref:Dihydroorotate dehydrogenase (quinone) n=1 Tax=Larsenimonas rhizosphaerae TaxID=2944682 RepID=A0AA41ZG25_9GAMM|nr:quinone-dependent dihydroorotate dehydrogenase [Larsenimonas rhizosphaerae]MCM2132039.1 quinone-dependent dihydroorotate dehydrogenase [Larsenimonas rhizosphaerae]MCX2524642.1 quinone-dependent dihydroorotate dehydrogenase [Larsenimonas rhizosphaerae]
MYSLVRPLLFRLDPEQAHGLTLSIMDQAHRLGLGQRSAQTMEVAEPVTLMGLSFPNRVGLAAGLDKNADHLDGLGALGFGFVEVGTVTPRPQPGNPKPRLFRLPARQAIINRMGFNNAGVDHLVRQVDASRYRGIVGINIGKNLTTAVDEAALDYLHALRAVHGSADYVTINISSPNTPGLRNLQFGDHLDQLLGELRGETDRLDDKAGRKVPLVVKIAPDMSDEEVQLVADCLDRHRIDGLIATNTTIDKSSVSSLAHGDEQGGLSGAPVREASTRIIRAFRERLPEMPIIGVGGILSAADALEKRRAGADLIQLYSGLIYRGPALVEECIRALAHPM